MAKRKRSSDKPMKGLLDFSNVAKKVINTEVKDFVPTTYFIYAASTIMDRALLGEDGLLPVQRRILWSMYVHKHFPGTQPAKVSSLMGDTMHYHPHGDASIESAIVRLGQPYSMRVPLIHPKGNFANIPGDDASAPRYISGSLEKAAMDLLEELKWDGVPMGRSYDGDLDEPPLIPVRWPVSVINGAQGIAVGYATLMAQHNPSEAMEVAKLILRKPDAPLRSIMSRMPGPDYSTGGIVMGTQGIKDYYETGKGSVVVRSRYRIDPDEGGASTITFYEVPPYVSVDMIISKITEIFDSADWKDSKDKAKRKKYDSYAAARKALNGIDRYIDQTDFDSDGVKIEISVKPGDNPRAVAMALFKYTSLQSSIPVNNTIIYEGRPQTVGIRELFLQFINFRRQCVLRVSQSKRESSMKRQHLIEGILALLLDMDKAISIIRSSASEDIARTKLMKGFKIDEVQADYILSMQLRRLTKQNSVALKKEHTELAKEISHLDGIIKDKKKLDDEVERLLDASKAIIGDERKMEILDKSEEEIKEMDKQARAAIRNADKDIPCVLTVLSDGSVLRSSGKEIPKERGVRSASIVSAKDKVIAIGTDGVGYAIPASYAIEGRKVSMTSLFSIPKEEKGLTIVPDGASTLTVSSDGQVKLTESTFNDKWSDHPWQKLRGQSRLVAALPVPETTKRQGTPEVILVSKMGKVIRFSLNDINATGLGAGGVAGMRLSKGDEVVGAAFAKEKTDVLTTTTRMTAKSTMVDSIPLQKRAGAGVILQKVMKPDAVSDVLMDAVLVAGRAKPKPIPPTQRDAPLSRLMPLPRNAYLALSPQE